jgi:hypothetical protein
LVVLSPARSFFQGVFRAPTTLNLPKAIAFPAQTSPADAAVFPGRWQLDGGRDPLADAPPPPLPGRIPFGKRNFRPTPNHPPHQPPGPANDWPKLG